MLYFMVERVDNHLGFFRSTLARALTRDWKRKQLIFCGSGSTLMKEGGSRSELGNESVEKELETEAFFQN